MTTLAATSAPTLSLGSKVPTDREKLASAAKQFEAIFVRQMLASARAVDFGGEGVFGEMDQTFVQMRDERFADIASKSGGLGFGKMIEAQLAKQAGLGQAGLQAPAPAGPK